MKVHKYNLSQLLGSRYQDALRATFGLRSITTTIFDEENDSDAKIEEKESPRKEEENEEKDEDDDEEECEDLIELMDSTTSSTTTPSQSIEALSNILLDPRKRFGPTASSLKERAIYGLVRLYCSSSQYSEIVDLLTGPTCEDFVNAMTKAKCAKIVRAVMDVVSSLAPSQLDMQAELCRNIISWCRSEKRTFLRHRMESKLASILFAKKEYGEALGLITALLLELKKLDDKQLLVETHLIECKIYHALRSLPKAKAALTASRTAANAIYVAPVLQSQIDKMSGTLHCEEGDYDTAHSYFLEAFEQLDALDAGEAAVLCLKYMMLCRILESLVNALKLSAKGGVGAKSNKSEVDISGMISGKQGVKYAGTEIEAMSAIAAAASRRSLKDFESTIHRYAHQLQDDLLIKHHLHILHEQLLESNLIRIIEPYDCVEISHVAKLIEMPVATVEKKLSQMILDGKFHGILDQGKGQLIVYEEKESDKAMEKGLEVIANMDKVVSSLFVRSRALRTMML